MADFDIFGDLRVVNFSQALNEHEKVILTNLILRRNNGNGLINPSVDTLSKDTSVGRRVVFQTLDGLKKKGVLTSKRTGRSNSYVINLESLRCADSAHLMCAKCTSEKPDVQDMHIRSAPDAHLMCAKCTQTTKRTTKGTIGAASATTTPSSAEAEKVIRGDESQVVEKAMPPQVLKSLEPGTEVVLFGEVDPALPQEKKLKAAVGLEELGLERLPETWIEIARNEFAKKGCVPNLPALANDFKQFNVKNRKKHKDWTGAWRNNCRRVAGWPQFTVNGGSTPSATPDTPGRVYLNEAQKAQLARDLEIKRRREEAAKHPQGDLALVGRAA